MKQVKDRPVPGMGILPAADFPGSPALSVDSMIKSFLITQQHYFSNQKSNVLNEAGGLSEPVFHTYALAKQQYVAPDAPCGRGSLLS